MHRPRVSTLSSWALYLGWWPLASGVWRPSGLGCWPCSGVACGEVVVWQDNPSSPPGHWATCLAWLLFWDRVWLVPHATRNGNWAPVLHSHDGSWLVPEGFAEGLTAKGGSHSHAPTPLALCGQVDGGELCRVGKDQGPRSRTPVHRPVVAA